MLPVQGVGDISDAELNSLGGEGWDLVAAVGEAGSYRLIFKRERA